MLSRVRKLARDRAFRWIEGAYVIEGPTLVSEALHSDLDIHFVLVSESLAFSEVADLARACGVECRVEKDTILDGLTTTRSTQTAIAVAAQHHLKVQNLPNHGFLLVLAELADPGNAGALVRSAEAFGASGVLFAGGVDPYNTKCVRASAGSLFRIPFTVVDGEDAISDTLDHLLLFGRSCWGSVPRGGLESISLPKESAVALLLGNESRGLPDHVLDRCSGLVSVATKGNVESLNVLVAGSLILHALSVQKRGD